jgi:hypothetical protein
LQSVRAGTRATTAVRAKEDSATVSSLIFVSIDINIESVAGVLKTIRIGKQKGFLLIERGLNPS